MEEFRQFRDTQYEVSNYGRVFATNFNRTGKRQELTYTQTRDGYVVVGLSNKGKMRWFRVHQLVAECFIPNPNKYTVINHKNEIKTDNRVENLEWCTVKYNCNYGIRNQKLSNAFTNRKDQSKKVAQIDENGNVIQIFPSINEASRQFNILKSGIIRCCKERQNTAGGFCWKYVE